MKPLHIICLGVSFWNQLPAKEAPPDAAFLLQDLLVPGPRAGILGFIVHVHISSLEGFCLYPALAPPFPLTSE